MNTKRKIRLIIPATVIVLLIVSGFAMVKRGITLSPGYPGEGDVFQSGVRWEPFTQPLPIPVSKEPTAPFEFQCSLPVFDGQQPAKFYEVRTRKGTAEIVPGFQTEIWGYDGIYPGSLLKSRHNEPAIIRFYNDLSETMTIPHLHGGHQTAQSDGVPTVDHQMIPPGEFRDFCYPNVAPIEPSTRKQEMSDYPSTLWYHDHAHAPGSPKGVTGRNVYHGLAGFHLTRDELEEALIRDGVLPSDSFDIPLAIQDRALDTQGQLIYNPEAVNYDGVLGDIPVVNGKAQPYLEVERRKYRFRILNGSTARFIQLKLTDGEFIQIGQDSWLLGEALTPSASDESGTRTGEIRLTPAERADVVIDFRNAPDEMFLQNILYQENGRKPDEVVEPGTPLIKFVVKGAPVENDATVEIGTPLRPHVRIMPEEIIRTRHFKFERTNGHWAINGRFYDHDRVEANPTVGTAERWILETAGGWAHPIHIHLEAHQIQSFQNREMDPQERFKKDTVRLQPGETAEIFIKARTFPGKFVFHCHNNEHEDFAMMFRWDVVEEEGLLEAKTVDKAQIAPGEPPLPSIGWSSPGAAAAGHGAHH